MYYLDYENAISNRGNQTRIKNVMKRALMGEKLTVGFLGGSITQGAVATRPELCYAYRVYDWWCKSFPKAEFTYVNAGIGATDSQFGCARVEEDLLCECPDFVIVEYSVNDCSDEHYLETYEGVVRRILSANPSIAVLIVHNIFYNCGTSAQLMHAKVARHYELPAVSMLGTIYAQMLAGNIPNREVTPDDLHPNDAGHGLVASVITYALQEMLTNIDVEESAEKPYPAPLTDNGYEDSRRFRNDRTEEAHIVSEGFVADTEPQNHITEIFKKGWTASSVGDRIRFTVEGSCLSVQYRKTMQLPAPIATLVLDGDTDHAMTLDANFDETWGDKLVLETVLEHGTPGPHDVEITISEAHSEDVLPFYLVSVIASGKK